MKDEVEFQKLNGKIVLFTIQSSTTIISEECCNHVKNSMDELEKEDYVNYIFDLQHLNIVSSHFVGITAKKHHSLMEKGGRIAILKASEMIQKSFELFGLAELIQFYADRGEAVKSFEQ